jgi:DNA-binding beta-propeller fold protein YncE
MQLTRTDEFLKRNGFSAKDVALMIPHQANKSLMIDPKTLKIVGTIPTGQRESHMLAITPDGRYGYTANVGPGTVSVLDMEKKKTLKIIPISGSTQRISVSIDGKLAFTSDRTKPDLVVIDTATNEIKKRVRSRIRFRSTPRRQVPGHRRPQRKQSFRH